MFLEGKIAPQTVREVQMHKHFDQWIRNLSDEKMFNITPGFFSDDIAEEKESFEYFFSPEKYMDKNLTLQKYYIESHDINGVSIKNCIKTIEIQE